MIPSSRMNISFSKQISSSTEDNQKDLGERIGEIGLGLLHIGFGKTFIVKNHPNSSSNPSFGLSSSDPEEVTTPILRTSSKANDQSHCQGGEKTRDANKLIEVEGEKPKTRVPTIIWQEKRYSTSVKVAAIFLLFIAFPITVPLMAIGRIGLKYSISHQSTYDRRVNKISASTKMIQRAYRQWAEKCSLKLPEDFTKEAEVLTTRAIDNLKQNICTGASKIYTSDDAPHLLLKCRENKDLPSKGLRVRCAKEIKKQIIRLRLTHLTIPNLKLTSKGIIEERLPISLNPLESISLYIQNHDLFTDAVKELTHLFLSTTSIKDLVQRLPFPFFNGEEGATRYDNLPLYIEEVSVGPNQKKPVGKIGLIDLDHASRFDLDTSPHFEYIKSTIENQIREALGTLVMIFPSHVKEIKEVAEKVLQKQIEEETRIKEKQKTFSLKDYPDINHHMLKRSLCRATSIKNILEKINEPEFTVEKPSLSPKNTQPQKKTLEDIANIGWASLYERYLKHAQWVENHPVNDKQSIFKLSEIEQKRFIEQLSEFIKSFTNEHKIQITATDYKQLADLILNYLSNQATPMPQKELHQEPGATSNSMADQLALRTIKLPAFTHDKAPEDDLKPILNFVSGLVPDNRRHYLGGIFKTAAEFLVTNEKILDYSYINSDSDFQNIEYLPFVSISLRY